MRYVRALSRDEVRKLEVMRRCEVGRVSQRAHMILLSNRRYTIAEIARIFDATQGTVRRWIERFEKEGIDCLADRPRSGRPPKVSAATLPLVERDVLASPASKGYLFNVWTAINLSVHLVRQYGIRVSQATIRRILVALDFRHNRPRHGPKKAVDPQLKEKLNAILGVPSSRVRGNHVLYEDEADIYLLPTIRAMWMKRGKQVRVPTPGTNSKKSIFGALDIRTGRWLYRFFDRKRTEQFTEFLNYIISSHSTWKISIILDNFSIHKCQSRSGMACQPPEGEAVLFTMLRAPAQPCREDLVASQGHSRSKQALWDHGCAHRGRGDVFQAIDGLGSSHACSVNWSKTFAPLLSRL